MKKAPWLKDLIIISIIIYLAFSFTINTMNSNLWTYTERGAMIFTILTITILIQFARAGNGEYN